MRSFNPQTNVYRKVVFLLLFSSFSFFSLKAQIVPPEEDYISEFIYGINLNTNGGLLGGIFIKGNKIIKPKWYRSLGLEIVHIKNNKEDRVTSANTGNSFIPGKRNYFYSFRFQYGRDIVLFRKAPEEGVQVSAVLAGGPSIGVLIPYIIIYNFGEPRGQVFEQYDPNVHVDANNILGTGSFLEGIGQSEFLFGAHVKAGLSLDFGTFRNSITGVEVGVLFEIFNKEAEIMGPPPFLIPRSPINILPDSEVPNRQFFPSLYLNIFFGSRK